MRTYPRGDGSRNDYFGSPKVGQNQFSHAGDKLGGQSISSMVDVLVDVAVAVRLGS